MYPLYSTLSNILISHMQIIASLMSVTSIIAMLGLDQYEQFPHTLSSKQSKLRDESSAKNFTDIDNNTLTLVRSSPDPKERGNTTPVVLVTNGNATVRASVPSGRTRTGTTPPRGRDPPLASNP